MLHSLKSLVAAAAALPAITASASTITFDYTGSIVSWTVPATGQYEITAVGANGGIGHASRDSAPGGRGAIIGGTLSLNAGTTLSILVGQIGQSRSAGGNGGGGGGSFVVIPNGSSPTPLVIAGGGGGGVAQSRDAYPGGPARIDRGSNPGYGSPASVTTSGGGGGLLTSGQNSLDGAGGGASFLLGGAGGIGSATDRGSSGGFGGGGGSGFHAGGGGGFSGGLGSGEGGGYSYLDDSATSPTLIAGGNSFEHGHGQVTITPVIVPEPSTTALLSLAAIPALRRRR